MQTTSKRRIVSRFSIDKAHTSFVKNQYQYISTKLQNKLNSVVTPIILYIIHTQNKHAHTLTYTHKYTLKTHTHIKFKILNNGNHIHKSTSIHLHALRSMLIEIFFASILFSGYMIVPYAYHKERRTLIPSQV